MVEFTAMKNGYKSYEISNIGFTGGLDNPADSFTKHIQSNSIENLIESGKVDFKID